MKKIYALIFFFLSFHTMYGQLQQICIVDFEDPLPVSNTPPAYVYTTSIPEDTDNDNDYFIRTDGSNLSGTSSSQMVYTNKQGTYFFGAQHLSVSDLAGGSGNLPLYLNVNGIDISGYTNLVFRVYLAEDQDLSAGVLTYSWEQNDYVHFDGYIDGSSTPINLIWVEAVAPTGGSSGDDQPPAIDTDFDGEGEDLNATVLREDFRQFEKSFTETGATLDIQVAFRLDNGEEDIAIDNIEVWGMPIPGYCFGGVATWDGSSWTGTPGIDAEVIIDGNYNTQNDGSFEACNLTVTSNHILNINNDGTIVVENDVVTEANASLIIQSGSALVQHNDTGLVTNNGTMALHRETAPMDAWYEYTYWSSPVEGAQISKSLPYYNPNRLFVFNAENYKDSTAETNNDNTAANGQDGIDDNGDDWQLIGDTTMQPGQGYITTTTPSYFKTNGSGAGSQFIAIFSGVFQNGVYEVDVYRNDDEQGDTNWNLIGNPYPSAIDSEQFFNSNPILENAIYFWSQKTAPSSTLNGNEQQNFNTADYAIINITGGVSSGGDGVSPEILALPSSGHAIPSGQSFFVALQDGAPNTGINSDKVILNNSMRTGSPAANSVFFKEEKVSKSSQPMDNKLWLNLNSIDNTSNQILVGYVDGATNSDDGLSYDANIKPVRGASLYSIIAGSDKKFAIQGKAKNSLTENEVIPLGFKTTLGVNIKYTISIDKIEGAFLKGYDVILLDKFQIPSKRWNLSHADYTFSSEQPGEFNNRFEIVFQSNALSVEAFMNPDDLRIYLLGDNKIVFKVPEPLTLNTIRIYNLIGQQIYKLPARSSEATYILDNLSEIFITEVRLSNGQILTKKGVRK